MLSSCLLAAGILALCSRNSWGWTEHQDKPVKINVLPANKWQDQGKYLVGFFFCFNVEQLWKTLQPRNMAEVKIKSLWCYENSPAHMPHDPLAVVRNWALY